jgi:hypothetical protein
MHTLVRARFVLATACISESKIKPGAVKIPLAIAKTFGTPGFFASGTSAVSIGNTSCFDVFDVSERCFGNSSPCS